MKARETIELNFDSPRFLGEIVITTDGYVCVVIAEVRKMQGYTPSSKDVYTYILAPYKSAKPSLWVRIKNWFRKLFKKK